MDRKSWMAGFLSNQISRSKLSPLILSNPLAPGAP